MNTPSPVWLLILTSTVEACLATSALWLPFVFVAYLIGRRTFSLRAILIFMVAEAAALAYYRWYVVYVLSVNNGFGVVFPES